MENMLFYNRFSYDRQMAKEVSFGIVFKMKLLRIVYIALAIATAISILLCVINGEVSPIQRLSFVWAIACYLMIPAMYFAFYYLCFPSYPADQNVSITVVEGEFIEHKWNEYSVKVAISKMIGCYETRNYIVLLLGRMHRVGVVVKKDSFSVGTSEEFVAYLKSKGVRFFK